MVDEPERRVVHAARLRVTGWCRLQRLLEILRAAALVDLGQLLPLLRIGHHHPAPALAVRAGRRLLRETDALEDDLLRHRLGEVESLAHRAGRAEKPVDAVQVEAAAQARAVLPTDADVELHVE